jgi:hypothetical protein
MKTKKKQIRKNTSMKKKGGARGLVLNIMYNKDNEIIDIKTQNILASNEYIERNKIDPRKYIIDVFKDTFDFSHVIDNTFAFLHPSDDTKKMKKRSVKIAINNQDDIKLIQITNKIIQGLNQIRSKPYFPVKEKDKTNKIRIIKKKYDAILQDNQSKILQYIINENDIDIASELLKSPILIQMIGIKFGLLRKGELSLEDMKDMYDWSIKDLRSYVSSNLIEPIQSSFTYNSRNDELQKENEELRAKILEEEIKINNLSK